MLADSHCDPHHDLRRTSGGRRARGHGRLPGLVAGSWVYGTLSTWIGDADKNRAWDLLCAAKQSYDLVMASGRLRGNERRAADDQLAVCESSDWFWWFGDYNPQQAVASFDSLFRRNLRRLYELLELPPPAALADPDQPGSGAPERAARCGGPLNGPSSRSPPGCRTPDAPRRASTSERALLLALLPRRTFASNPTTTT